MERDENSFVEVVAADSCRRGKNGSKTTKTKTNKKGTIQKILKRFLFLFFQIKSFVSPFSKKHNLYFSEGGSLSALRM
jgi:hypothetical protein